MFLAVHHSSRGAATGSGVARDEPSSAASDTLHRRGDAILESPSEIELLFHLVCEVLAATLTAVHIGAVATYLVKKGLYAL